MIKAMVYIAVFFILRGGHAAAQHPVAFAAGSRRVSPVLTGNVVDSSTGDALVGATVVLKERNIGTMTRADGSFIFDDLPTGLYTLQVRYIGFREKNIIVPLRESTHLTIALAPEPLLLPEISVTANAGRYREHNATQSVEVLTPAELDRHRGQTLGATLENIPGVTVMQTGPSISKPVIRGLHSQRVKIVNGGVAQEGQQWGGEHAPEIDPFDADRIEVIKGAAGVEYGAGAIGGVVRLEPRAFPRAFGLGGTLSLNAFSNNLQPAASLMLEGRHNTLPALAWRAQGGFRRAGNARSPGYWIGNTAFEEYSGSLAGGYEIGQLELDATYRLFATTLGIYRGSHIGNYDDLIRAITAGRPLTDDAFSYDIAAPRQEIRHDVASLVARYHAHGYGTLEAQLAWQTNHRREYDVHKRWFDTTATATRPAFDLRLNTETAELRFRHEPTTVLSGSAGVNLQRQTNVGNSLSFLIPNFRSHAAGLHIIEHADLKDWLLEAGARADYQETRVYAYAPKNVPDTTHSWIGLSAVLGARWAFAEDWSLAANAGAAWRPPSVNELYSNGVHHGTAQYEIGDPSLRGEYSASVDLTLRHSGNETTVELSASNSLITDFISLVPEAEPTLTLRGLFPTFRYMQYDRVLLSALDASLEQRVTPFWRLGGNVSLVYAAVLPGSAPLHQMPSPRMRISSHFHLPALGPLHEPYFEITGLLVSRQTRYAEQFLQPPAGAARIDITPPPGYALADLAFGGDLPLLGTTLSVSLQVKNLFNTAYRDYLSRFRYYVDEPGRDIILRLQLPFGQAAVPEE